MIDQATLKEKIALACTLTNREQIQRMSALHKTLFRKVVRVTEQKTNYTLIFQQADSNLPTELIEFIIFERLCCPWLKFRLTFPPAEGPIRLQMGNSVETKEMVKLVMELDKLDL